MIINVFAFFTADKSTYYIWRLELVNWAARECARVTEVTNFSKIPSVSDQSEKKKNSTLFGRYHSAGKISIIRVVALFNFWPIKCN